jgi:hypothetical protein
MLLDCDEVRIPSAYAVSLVHCAAITGNAVTQQAQAEGGWLRESAGFNTQLLVCKLQIIGQINKRHPKSGHAPLHFAAYRGHVQTVAVLVLNGQISM